jgi:hypothetical protein
VSADERRVTYKEKTDAVAAFSTIRENLPSQTSDVMVLSVPVLVVDRINP